MPNLTPGYATMKADAITDYSFPFGKHWLDKKEIGDELDVWAKQMRAREEQRADEIYAECDKVRKQKEAESHVVARTAMFAAGLGLGAAIMFLINKKN